MTTSLSVRQIDIQPLLPAIVTETGAACSVSHGGRNRQLHSQRLPIAAGPRFGHATRRIHGLPQLHH